MGTSRSSNMQQISCQCPKPVRYRAPGRIRHVLHFISQCPSPKVWLRLCTQTDWTSQGASVQSSVAASQINFQPLRLSAVGWDAQPLHLVM